MFGNLTNLEGSLFDEFRRLEQQVDELFGRGGRLPAIRSVVKGTFPPINVGVTPEKVDVYVFSAGLDSKTLDVSIQQNLLTISGERKSPEAENARYYRKERFQGEFRRVITLPEDVDPERVVAQYTDGILHVAVQRREASRPRQIEIK
ncbi:Hsp20/alpha crystallin family protein [Methylococcus sp. EFPC2]|uniref:Hsp20/alpha crystallin family protein n=1 Tax=Methylococcus sp. EFPC2 TaxID=2812648 RepID=UPI001967A3BA|nr:Hsp20/alpha crystallin family protein [Methylococcus sp. EFPC2]QSA98630.1 Hsp20/alpha crystallin family protein [Methylococcus sp. EFPC2]